MKKRLYRSKTDKKVEGVCGGIAEYFDIDSTIVRVIFLLAAFTTNGIGLVAYIIAMIVIPVKPDGYTYDEDVDVEEIKPDGTSKETGVRTSGQTFGILLIIVGGLLLSTKILPWMDSSMIMAIGVIGLGAYIVMRKK